MRKMAISNEGVLYLDTTRAVKSVKELRENIKVYRDKVVAAGKDSEKYREALKKLAESQSQLNKINRDVRASTLNLTDAWGQAANVLGGLVSGFNAFKSVTTLLGVENDKLAETFVKLQAGMNLVQSLTSVSKGFKSLQTLLPSVRTAFAALNATMAANPVLAIVAGIAALIAIGATLITWLKNAKADTEGFNQALRDNEAQISNLEFAYNAEYRSLKRNGASKSELIVLEQKYTVAMRASAQAALAKMDALGKLTKEQKKTRDELVKTIKDYDKTIQDLFDEHRETLLDEQKAADDKAKAERKRAAEQAYKEEQQRQEALEKLDREFWARIEANQKAAGQRIIDSIRAIDEEARQEFEDADDVNIPWIETLDSYYKSFTSPEAIDARRAAYEEEINNLWMLANDETESVAVRAKAFQDYYKQKERYQIFDKKATAVYKKLRDDEIKAEEMKFKAVSSFLGLAGNLLAENTVAAKGVSVASALVSAYAGSAQVLADPKLQFYAKLAAYASILSAGLGAVKSAKSVKIPGASSSADVPVSTTPAIPDLSTVYTPTITPYVQELRSEEEREYNTRVYITQDDIADSMRQVEVRQNNTVYQ